MRISDWSSDVVLFRSIEGCLRRDRRHAARPICRIECPSPQPGDEHGAQRRVTCGDRRHVAPPIAGIDDDLCDAGCRRPWFDSKTKDCGGCITSYDTRHVWIEVLITCI